MFIWTWNNCFDYFVCNGFSFSSIFRPRFINGHSLPHDAILQLWCSAHMWPWACGRKTNSFSLASSLLPACVYIYIRQLSSFRAPTFIDLLCYLPYSIHFSGFLLIFFFLWENGQNTKILEVCDFCMIRKWFFFWNNIADFLSIVIVVFQIHVFFFHTVYSL